MEIKCLGWTEKCMSGEDKELRPEEQWTPVVVISNLYKSLPQHARTKLLARNGLSLCLVTPCSCRHGASSCLEFCILLLASQN